MILSKMSVLLMHYLVVDYNFILKLSENTKDIMSKCQHNNPIKMFCIKPNCQYSNPGGCQQCFETDHKHA